MTGGQFCLPSSRGVAYGTQGLSLGGRPAPAPGQGAFLRARLVLPGPGRSLQGLASGAWPAFSPTSDVHTVSRDTLGTPWALCLPRHVV